MPLARQVRNQLLKSSGLLYPEVAIFDVTHKCTSKCGGCAFREPEQGELGWRQWAALAREARELGFREIMITGGEPLSRPDAADILRRTSQELPVSLMTNGLALKKHADVVRATVARVFVSWDAHDETTYEQIRGVRGLSAVRDGVRAITGMYVHARVTVWNANVNHLTEIRDAAVETGFTEMSLLAADTTSGGFGKRQGVENAPATDSTMVRRFFSESQGRFLAMSDYAKSRLLALIDGTPSPPRCAAPWTSGVVGPTGTWSHCFFLETTATTEFGLRAAMRSTRPARRALDIATNPVCARCVCWRG